MGFDPSETHITNLKAIAFLSSATSYVNAIQLFHCDSPVGESEPAPVAPGNDQPLPPGRQQQDVPVLGHS